MTANGQNMRKYLGLPARIPGSDIVTSHMGDASGGWTDVYQNGEYIGYVYVQNLPTTRYLARDVNGEYIAEGDYASEKDAISAIVAAL